jgi:hypothetical protein
MHSTGSTPIVGAITSLTFLSFSFIPEVPPVAQWICLVLSALASIITIIKNSSH